MIYFYLSINSHFIIFLKLWIFSHNIAVAILFLIISFPFFRPLRITETINLLNYSITFTFPPIPWFFFFLFVCFVLAITVIDYHVVGGAILVRIFPITFDKIAFQTLSLSVHEFLGLYIWTKIVTDFKEQSVYL